jgi:hypothetical protein
MEVMTAAAQRDDDDDKVPEPHPLPLTRKWVEDYKQFGTKPEGEEEPEAIDHPPRRNRLP